MAVDVDVEGFLLSTAVVGGLLRWLDLWPPRAWCDGKALSQILHLKQLIWADGPTVERDDPACFTASTVAGLVVVGVGLAAEEDLSPPLRASATRHLAKSSSSKTRFERFAFLHELSGPTSSKRRWVADWFSAAGVF